MKSSTCLDKAVFQLTPTRTRCDLVISVNGKTEKIASGLLNPFIAHLKTAQEQVAKGGYSIILQPESCKDALWFTKGTLERFVRFVSTPEILERVYTLESEILQIEEAISFQGINEMALTVEESQAKPSESIEGSRPLSNGNDEKAIVLYEPGGQLYEANGTIAPEKNSKVQLLKVLETRKTVLQKEQGMAFARAVAAGFDTDNMSTLLSFSECFGASRLKDACNRFKELWKKKHEMGQWLEIEAAEVMSSRSEFSAMNASGIMLSSVANKNKELKETWPDLASETSSNAFGTTGTDEKPALDNQPPHGHQEYFQGQFPYQYPPWPIHSSPGALPVFQGYPMQPMPYYQNYPGAGPYYQPPYPMAEDPRLNPGQRIQKRHSMDSSNSNLESESRVVDDADLEKEGLQIQESRKRTSRFAKKKSGMVVIRNINYIASNKYNSSDTESQSVSDSQTEEEDGSSTLEKKHKKSQRLSKRQGDQTDKPNEPNKAGFEEEADGGLWQAFQNLLLSDANDEGHVVDQGMFAMETKAQLRKLQNTAGDDPITSGDQDTILMQNGSIVDMQKMSGIVTHMPKNSTDESLISEREGHLIDGRSTVDDHMDGRRVGYRRSTNNDFMIRRPENQPGFTTSPSDLLNEFDRTSNHVNRRSSHNMDEDSYIVSLRSTGLDQIQSDKRNAIDMDSEFFAATQKPENMSTRAGSQDNYEPDELSLMPHRVAENEASGYDPAFDYEMQVQTEDGVSLKKKNKEVVTDSNKGAKKLGKDQKSKMIPDASDKKKLVGPIRRVKPSKLSPLDEAKARAEKLRSFKADLQKMKKEKEEEETKRLEALKLARQKRIAAKSSNVQAQSALSSLQSRKQIPAKTSPSSHKGSKFSDSESGPSSPLQRCPIKTSLGSTSLEKTFKPSRLNTGSHSPGNRLIRSASSLPEQKKENTIGVATHSKTSMSRIRRLSEPKMSSSVTAVKLRSNETISKSKVSDGPPNKNISAIVNHDKTKAATLPELKTRTSKGSDVTSKSAAKEMTQKGNQNRPSANSGGAEPNRTNDNISYHNDVDYNMIVDKSVVILEREKPSIPAISVSEDNARIKNKECDNVQIREKPEVESAFAVVHPSASPYTTGAVGSKPTGHHLHKQIDAQRVPVDDSEKESPKLSNIAITEKPYQAPYARVSSFEDPCTGNSEYGKAPPTSLDSAATSSMAVKSHVSNYRDLKLEKIAEATEKSQVKESSKRFKRLLKFGRKNNNSAGGERNADSDNVSTNGSEADDRKNAAGHSEVPTLKNLISQDETSTVTTTPQKSSRHFSLLSPFRSKTTEKKPAA